MESWFAIKRSISSKVPVPHLHTMELTKQLKLFQAPSLFFHFGGQELLQKYPTGFFSIPGGEADNTKTPNCRSNAWKYKSQIQ